MSSFNLNPKNLPPHLSKPKGNLFVTHPALNHGTYNGPNGLAEIYAHPICYHLFFIILSSNLWPFFTEITTKKHPVLKRWTMHPALEIIIESFVKISITAVNKELDGQRNPWIWSYFQWELPKVNCVIRKWIFKEYGSESMVVINRFF